MASVVARPAERPWQRRLKWSLRILLFHVLIAYALYVAVNLSCWNDFVTRHEALKARLKFRAGKGWREPLVGPPEAGVAGEEYRAVFADLKAGMNLEQAAFIEIELGDENRSPSRPEDLDDVLAPFVLSLERLRVGSRRESSSIPSTAFQVTGNPRYYDGTGAIRAGQLLTFSARQRQRRGDLEGALVDVSTCLQMALDIGQEPETSLDTVLARLGLDGLKHLLTDPALTPDRIAAVERMLMRLETVWPSPGEELERLSAYFYKCMLDGTDDGWLSRAHGGWILECLRRRYESWEAGLLKGQALDWEGADSVYEDLGRRDRASWNHFEDLFCIHVSRIDREWRRLCAGFRLLRAAALVRLGKGPEIPGWPLDPFSLKPLNCRPGIHGTHITLVRKECGNDGLMEEVVVPSPRRK